MTFPNRVQGPNGGHPGHYGPIASILRALLALFVVATLSFLLIRHLPTFMVRSPYVRLSSTGGDAFVVESFGHVPTDVFAGVAVALLLGVVAVGLLGRGGGEW